MKPDNVLSLRQAPGESPKAALDRAQREANETAAGILSDMLTKTAALAAILDLMVANPKAFPPGIIDLAKRQAPDLRAKADTYAAIAGRRS